MEDFKTLPKMACFKEGGHVKSEKLCGGGRMKEGGKVHDDAAQDKALIKKELTKFAKSEDKGEKTELKLNCGGRAKKAAGTVKKYNAGGAIEMKKSSGDIDTIKKIKATGAKEASAPSKAAVKSKNVPVFKKGGKVKKADGGIVEGIKNLFTDGKSSKADEKAGAAAKKVAPTPNSMPEKRKLTGAYAPSAELAKFNDNYKKGGKVKKFADGGSVDFGRGGIASSSPIPPSIAAQLMQAQQDTALVGNNPSPMGNPTVPGDNPVISGGSNAVPPNVLQAAGFGRGMGANMGANRGITTGQVPGQNILNRLTQG